MCVPSLSVMVLMAGSPCALGGWSGDYAASVEEKTIRWGDEAGSGGFVRRRSSEAFLGEGFSEDHDRLWHRIGGSIWLEGWSGGYSNGALDPLLGISVNVHSKEFS